MKTTTLWFWAVIFIIFLFVIALGIGQVRGQEDLEVTTLESEEVNAKEPYISFWEDVEVNELFRIYVEDTKVKIKYTDGYKPDNAFKDFEIAWENYCVIKKARLCSILERTREFIWARPADYEIVYWDAEENVFKLGDPPSIQRERALAHEIDELLREVGK